MHSVSRESSTPPARALILGGTGLLGREVEAFWRERGATVRALSHAEGDLADERGLTGTVASFRPDWVINCAAMTRVDDCEAQREAAFAANARGAGNAARAAAAAGARLLHVSTDYVFPGNAGRPYREDDPTGPLSVYGASKLQGEEEVLAVTAARALVVRVSWLFGQHGANFPTAILRQIEQRRASGDRSPLRVVDDQLGCPTYAPYVAVAFWDLASQNASGVVHYRNEEPVTWFGFASTLVEEAMPELPVEPVATRDVPRPAPRPSYSVLGIERFEQITGRPVESWRPGLRDYLRTYLDRRERQGRKEEQ